MRQAPRQQRKKRDKTKRGEVSNRNKKREYNKIKKHPVCIHTAIYRKRSVERDKLHQGQIYTFFLKGMTFTLFREVEKASMQLNSGELQKKKKKR